MHKVLLLQLIVKSSVLSWIQISIILSNNMIKETE